MVAVVFCQTPKILSITYMAICHGRLTAGANPVVHHLVPTSSMSSVIFDEILSLKPIPALWEMHFYVIVPITLLLFAI